MGQRAAGFLKVSSWRPDTFELCRFLLSGRTICHRRALFLAASDNLSSALCRQCCSAQVKLNFGDGDVFSTGLAWRHRAAESGPNKSGRLKSSFANNRPYLSSWPFLASGMYTMEPSSKIEFSLQTKIGTLVLSKWRY